MIEARNEPTQVEREATAWFTRLLNPPVENEDLAAFEAWRRDPGNLAAYNRVEDISRLALSLQDDPEIRAMAQTALAGRCSSAPRRTLIGSKRAVRWGVGLAITGLMAASAIVWRVTAPTYETPVGRQIAARLPDGTQVRLNTNSALRVRFDKGVRRVELSRGQAFFEVAHDPVHPFIVVAGDTEVRAIGTRFDVRREDRGAKVVLTEGKVAVTEHGARTASWTLTPGQTVSTSKRDVAPRPMRTDTAIATGWTEGRLSFRATPLHEAIDEVNRYTRAKIILGPDVPTDTRVNGDFDIAKPSEFIMAITTLYGLRTERRLGGDIELRGAAS